jgi:RNA polymerase sigma-70 factor (ECF subfamily)
VRAEVRPGEGRFRIINRRVRPIGVGRGAEGGFGRVMNPPRASFRPVVEISTAVDASAEREKAELIDLVLRAQQDEMTAQSELVRRYTVRISAFVRPILFQPSSVEDVVQMVFIKMVRRLTLLRDPAVFESWLFRLSRNTAVDFLRRRRCRPTMVSDDVEFERAPDTSSEGTVAEIMEALAMALTHLSPKDRNLVTMIVEGNSYRTVAAREGLTVGAVKVRLNRVRPFLRSSVGGAIGVRAGAPTGGKWRQPARSRLAVAA